MSAHNVISCERPGKLRDRAERIRVRAPPKIKLMLDQAAENGSSVWLTALSRNGRQLD